MIYAINNGVKIPARPELTGVCPLCFGKVIPKCGDLNIWHWAHITDPCESKFWTPEGETKWHLYWKECFRLDQREYIFKNKEGIKHRADIYTEKGVVIELQNSPISKRTIAEREDFYGEKMIWIINGTDFDERFEIASRYWEIEYGRIKDNEYTFWWERPRKSWKYAWRDVFIDFGTNEIYWVKRGMGTGSGYVACYTKERFLKHYGGDFSVLAENYEDMYPDEIKDLYRDMMFPDKK